MPKTGDLVARVCRRTRGSRGSTNPGVLYTNNGTENSPAVLGHGDRRPEVHQLRGTASSRSRPRRCLQVTPDKRRGADHRVRAGPEPGCVHVVRRHVGDGARRQTRVEISGGFGNDKASNNDPKAFTYQFDDNIFPNVPLDPTATELRRGMGDSPTSTTMSIRCISTSTTFRCMQVVESAHRAPRPACSRGVSTTSNVPAPDDRRQRHRR